MCVAHTTSLLSRLRRLTRRELFRRGGLLGLGLSATPAAQAGLRVGPNLYESIGIRPLINCRGTLTIIGGSIELPEVRAAKDLANQKHVQLDELMEAAGKRLAELTGAEWGMVSSGCAAALTHATAACVAGGNPDLHVRIPNLAGFAILLLFGGCVARTGAEPASALDPIAATMRGVLGHDHEVTDYSPDGVAARTEHDRTTAAAARALDPADDHERVAIDLLVERLETSVSMAEAHEHLRQATQRAVGIVLEGGEGARKSTQVRELTVWLRDQGFDVVGTRQPGATRLGMRLRGILLDRENSHITDRAEVLLYAADKADHVEQEILPALRRGAVVISDRYVDSLLAYQGAGRDLAVEEVAEISSWATQGLVPDLTVLLDVRPEDGLSRLGGPADRIESESVEFHARVRKGFRALAEAAPDRYLVLDAREPQEKITREIQRRIRPLLPDPIDSSSEAVTGMIPVIRPEQDA